jgi:hypothetical protein
VQIDYYAVEVKAIELGLIKISDIDGSHSFNVSMNKLYALILSFADNQAATD